MNRPADDGVPAMIDDPAFPGVEPTRARVRGLTRLTTSFALLLGLAPSVVSGQVPPRFYWKTLEA